jgi:uncharacterized protein (TIGR03435 family)
MAYDLKRYQLAAPDWLSTVKFDITARVPAGATRNEFRLMLRNLLAERFKLAAHTEVRELPVYELVIAKNGPLLKESVEVPATPDTTDTTRPVPPAFTNPKLDKDGYPELPPGQPGMMMFSGRARMYQPRTPIEAVCTFLAAQLGRPVKDATGLKAKYDVAMYWALERPTPNPPDTDAGPTLVQALREQLGLGLNASKSPFDVLIVDHAEKVPTQN